MPAPVDRDDLATLMAAAIRFSVLRPTLLPAAKVATLIRSYAPFLAERDLKDVARLLLGGEHDEPVEWREVLRWLDKKREREDDDGA